MRRALALTGFTLLLLGAASPAVAGSAPRQETPAPTDTLRVAVATDTEYRGGFGEGSAAVAFGSKILSPVRTTATIQVNGKSFTVDRDVKAGTATWTGNGATLTPDDRAAMLRFDKALLTDVTAPVRNKAKESVPASQDLLARLSALVAEAPLGIRFTTQEVPKPPSASTDTKYTPAGLPAVESCLQDVIRMSDSNSSTRDAGVLACQQSGEDGILYFGSCGVTGRLICHDADSHCYTCGTVQSGYGSSVDCLGRCGPGCGIAPPTGGHGPYTYDCGDHDECGRAHGGSTNPWDSECGDEYWEADDDFLWGNANC